MKAVITEKLVADLVRDPRDIEVRDDRCRGLILRCRASGHTYRFQVRRGAWVTIGRIDDFKPPAARLEAEKLRGDVAHGKDSVAERRVAHASSLGRFIETEYAPWVLANRKTGQATLDRLAAIFAEFDAVPLADLNVRRLEQWRTARLAADTSPSTVNRDIAALRSVLTRAVEFGILTAHPLAGLKASKVDQRPTVRFLSADEEARLRAALAARDTKRREARATANVWRATRGYSEWLPFGTYTDHLTPLVLTALNTGLRRGELLGLTWADLDLPRAVLTVQGAGAKSGDTRHVPLNADIVAVLTAWRGPDVDRTGFVFGDADGEQLDGARTSWQSVAKAAALEDFRFHDLRHTFASKLVQAGVDLNTVRELLGHADLKMTLRYSHLGPEHKAAAVAKLVRAGA